MGAVDLAMAEPAPHVTRDERPWGPEHRLAAYEAHVATEEENKAKEERGEAPLLKYRRLYVPEQGMFKDLPAGLGNGEWAEVEKEEEMLARVEQRDDGMVVVADGTEVRFHASCVRSWTAVRIQRRRDAIERRGRWWMREREGLTPRRPPNSAPALPQIRPGDFAYIGCGFFELEELALDDRPRPDYVKSAKGELSGVDAWHVVRVEDITKGGKVRVRWMMRPEEVSMELR